MFETLTWAWLYPWWGLVHVYFGKYFRADSLEAVEIYEPPRGKTNNVVFEQVRHKPTCTVTEKI